MPKRWKPEEDAILIANFSLIGVSELENVLGRSRHGIYKRAERLKLDPPNSHLWSQEEDDLLNVLYENTAISKIMELLPKRSRQAIRNRATKVLGLKRVDNREWSEEEDKFICDNYGNISTTDMCREMGTGRKRSTIKKRARDIGLCCTSEQSDYLKRTLYHDVNYFHLPSIENSYWAGFLAADGCVRSRGNSVKLSLGYKDHKHLERFCTDVAFTGRPKVYTKVGGFKASGSKMSEVIIHCKRWVKDLDEVYNIRKQKTFLLEPPQLDYYNSLSYIIGYIDGDGCIYGLTGKTKYMSIDLLGTKNLLKWTRDIFIGIDRRCSRSHILKKNKIFRYSTIGSKALQILVESTKVDVPRLRRKWGKYVDYFNLDYNCYSY